MADRHGGTAMVRGDHGTAMADDIATPSVDIFQL